MTSRRIVFLIVTTAAVVGVIVALGFETYSTWNGEDLRAEEVARDWWQFSMWAAIAAVFFYGKD